MSNSPTVPFDVSVDLDFIRRFKDSRTDAHGRRRHVLDYRQVGE